MSNFVLNLQICLYLILLSIGSEVPECLHQSLQHFNSRSTRPQLSSQKLWCWSCVSKICNKVTKILLNDGFKRHTPSRLRNEYGGRDYWCRMELESHVSVHENAFAIEMKILFLHTWTIHLTECYSYAWCWSTVCILYEHKVLLSYPTLVSEYLGWVISGSFPLQVSKDCILT